MSGLLLTALPGLGATLLAMLGLLPLTAPAIGALGGAVLAVSRRKPRR